MSWRVLLLPTIFAASVASAAVGADIAAMGLQSPEVRLRSAVDAMQQGDLNEALRNLDALVRDQPNFRVAQLVYSQLLAARAGTANGMFVAADDDVSALLEEVRLRLSSIAPPPGSVPQAVLQLSERHRYALLADLPRARLYLLENHNGSARVRSDYYMAMGKSGYGKQTTGDNRTPVGIYRIIDWLDGKGLPELYGVGAFPTNYPNAWDRALGKTGYGIWLHGVPGDTYSRLPRSSEGCVTVANADLMKLRDYVTPGKTPIVLSDDARWLPNSEAEVRRVEFLSRVDDWRRAWSRKDTDAYLDFYSSDFTVDNMDFEAFARYKRRVNASKRYIEVRLDDIDLFVYPGEDDLVLASFEQHYESDNYVSDTRKQQYWRRELDGIWRIVREESE